MVIYINVPVRDSGDRWADGMTTVYPVGSAATAWRPVSRGIGEKIPERLLAKLWKDRAARQTGLRTEAGKRVRVVYPGRTGTAAGPDFRDALLEVEGLGLVRGDVELHIRQRDWKSHGHGGDPNYNGVVIHGALEVDSEDTRLRSGVRAPVVDLRALLEEPSEKPGPLLDLWEILARRGFPRPGSPDEAAATLDRAGDRRFQLKSAWLSECIRALGPDQALYQALMEGLGYSSNRRPFTELASRAPYQALTRAAGRLPAEERSEAICGWLTACSGLAEPESPRPRWIGPAMNREEWRLFRVRPANHPRRRIQGAAMLLDRFLEPGLAAGLAEVASGLSPAKLIAALCAAGTEGPALVGPARAKDLAVNAVLPFMHGWPNFGGENQEPEGAPALFRRFPSLADNQLTREMTIQLLPAEWHKTVTNARRQQGLLHLAALLRGAH